MSRKVFNVFILLSVIRNTEKLLCARYYFIYQKLLYLTFLMKCKTK